ncbi:redoxin domain-containing protein [bacterium]|nr:MAG: redoxin domain-containing protein [bacterium]
MKKILPLVLTLSIAPLAFAAQEQPSITAPDPKTVDPAALTLLNESLQAYSALSGLSMHYEARDLGVGGAPASSGTISVSQPDKIKIETVIAGKRTLTLTDGAKIYTQNANSTYRVDGPGRGTTMEAMLFRLPAGLNLPLGGLLKGNNLVDLGYVRWDSISFLPGNGVKLKTQVGKNGPIYDFDLYFGETDKLLRRVESSMVDKGKKSLTLATLSEVRANPDFAPDAFAYTPPAGVKLAVDPPMFDPKLKVGAAPYALKGKDLSGKPVNWKQYAGKVVLLDFWATWCGPCVGELPNVLKNYKTYHPKGFEIVGVSLDNDKKALTDFVKDRKLQYVNVFDGQGWKSADAKSYGVMAIPFTLLIGKNGKIAAVNPRGEALEPAIKKALAG